MTSHDALSARRMALKPTRALGVMCPGSTLWVNAIDIHIDTMRDGNNKDWAYNMLRTWRGACTVPSVPRRKFQTWLWTSFAFHAKSWNIMKPWDLAVRRWVFHLAIGSPSIPNFYRSFWSRIKSTSRSFWRLLQDSQVDLYVPRVLPSITTFRSWVVFQCQFDCENSGGSCAHWGAQPLVLSGGLRSSTPVGSLDFDASMEFERAPT